MRKDKPILFRTDMVQAIRAGRKTQTRRISSNYKTGQRLWIRETWNEINDKVYYRADNPDLDIKWKPSIFMPKDHARIWLRVTDIHEEKLQNISDGDAKQEGCFGMEMIRDVGPEDVIRTHRWNPITKTWSMITNREAFIFLWDSINKKRGYGWDSNPDVYVIKFKLINTGD